MKRLALLLFLVGCGDETPMEPPGEQQACITYSQYGQEMMACGPVCAAHSDCASNCCYPTETGGACVDVMFCDHARANGHNI